MGIDSPSYRLWDNLKKAQLYTNSYDEFLDHFSTDSSRAKLYNKLNEAKLYTNSYDEFIKRFFDEEDENKAKENLGMKIPDGIQPQQTEIADTVQQQQAEPTGNTTGGWIGDHIDPTTGGFLTHNDLSADNMKKWAKDKAQWVGGLFEQLGSSLLDIVTKNPTDQINYIKKLSDLPTQIVSKEMKLLGVNDEWADNIGRAIRHIAMPQMSNIIDASSKIRNAVSETEAYKDLVNTADKLKEHSNRYDKDLLTYIKNREYGKMAGSMAYSTVSTLPSILVAAMGGPVGVAYFGLQAAGEQYDNLEGREDMPELNKMINATFVGAANALTIGMGSAGLQKLMKTAYEVAGKDAAEQLVGRSLNTWLANVYKKYGLYTAPVAMGVEGAANEFASSITNWATGAEPWQGVDEIGRRMAESGLEWAGTGAFFTGEKIMKDIASKKVIEGKPEGKIISEKIPKEKVITKEPVPQYKLGDQVFESKEDLFSAIREFKDKKNLPPINISNDEGAVKEANTLLDEFGISEQVPEPTAKVGVHKDVFENIDKTGGATITREGLLYKGKSGYGVGTGDENAELIDTKEITPDKVSDYFDRKKDILAADKRNHMGVWEDKKTGQTVFEISHIFENFDQAIAEAKRLKQKTIWDYAENKEIKISQTEKLTNKIQINVDNTEGGKRISGTERRESIDAASILGRGETVSENVRSFEGDEGVKTGDNVIYNNKAYSVESIDGDNIILSGKKKPVNKSKILVPKKDKFISLTEELDKPISENINNVNPVELMQEANNSLRKLNIESNSDMARGTLALAFDNSKTKGNEKKTLRELITDAANEVKKKYDALNRTSTTRQFLTNRQVNKNAPGSTITTPNRNLNEAVRNNPKETGDNLWIRQGKSENNKKRTLMVQFSSAFLNPSDKTQPNSFEEYYDKLYNTRKGYDRTYDFWEVPLWISRIAHIDKNADVYVVRNINEAKKFFKEAGYDNLVFSALDVNEKYIKEFADADPDQKFSVGGYTNFKLLQDSPNVIKYENVSDFAKQNGLPDKEGYDYRHFFGTRIIPRLKLSSGCKYKCAFCTIPKEILEVDPKVIDAQIESIKDLDARLVYLDDKTFGDAPNYKRLPELYEKIKELNPDFEGFIIQTTASRMLKFPDNYLQSAHIKYVELGVESYNDPILKKLHKPATEKIIDAATEKLRKNKINFIPNIVVGLAGEEKGGGHWEETTDTYDKTLNFLEKNKDIISHINVYNLALYEGTELADNLGVKSEADRNENNTVKSFHKDKNIHIEALNKFTKLASEMLDREPFKEGGTQNAESTGIETEKTGTQEGTQGRPAAGVRLWNAEKNRVGAQQGEELPVQEKINNLIKKVSDIRNSSETKRDNISIPENSKNPEELLSEARKTEGWWGDNMRKVEGKFIFIPVRENNDYGNISVEYSILPNPNKNTEIVPRYRYDIFPDTPEGRKDAEKYPEVFMYDKSIIDENLNIVDKRYTLRKIGTQDELSDDKYDPDYLYRGISKPELESIIKTGKIKSTARMNLSRQEETTSFAQNPAQAESYASGFAAWHDVNTFDSPSYVIKIKKEGVSYEPAIKNQPQDEVNVKKDVPASNITDIWEIRRATASEGNMEIRKNRQDKIMEGGRSPMGGFDASRKFTPDEVSSVINKKYKFENEVASIEQPPVPPVPPETPVTAEGNKTPSNRKQKQPRLYEILRDAVDEQKVIAASDIKTLRKEVDARKEAVNSFITDNSTELKKLGGAVVPVLMRRVNKTFEQVDKILKTKYQGKDTNESAAKAMRGLVDYVEKAVNDEGERDRLRAIDKVLENVKSRKKVKGEKRPRLKESYLSRSNTDYITTLQEVERRANEGNSADAEQLMEALDIQIDNAYRDKSPQEKIDDLIEAKFMANFGRLFDATAEEAKNMNKWVGELHKWGRFKHMVDAKARRRKWDRRRRWMIKYMGGDQYGAGTDVAINRRTWGRDLETAVKMGDASLPSILNVLGKWRKKGYVIDHDIGLGLDNEGQIDRKKLAGEKYADIRKEHGSVDDKINGLGMRIGNSMDVQIAGIKEEISDLQGTLDNLEQLRKTEPVKGKYKTAVKGKKMTYNADTLQGEILDLRSEIRQLSAQIEGKNEIKEQARSLNKENFTNYTDLWHDQMMDEKDQLDIQTTENAIGATYDKMYRKGLFYAEALGRDPMQRMFYKNMFQPAETNFAKNKFEEYRLIDNMLVNLFGHKKGAEIKLPRGAKNWSEKQKKNFIDKKRASMRIIEIKTPVDSGVEYLDENGERKSLIISQLQGLQKYLELKYPDNWDKLYAPIERISEQIAGGNGFIEGVTEGQLEKFLDDDVKELGKWLLENNKRWGDRIQKPYMEENGMPLPLLKDYVSITPVSYGFTGNEKELDQQTNFFQAVTSNHFKERVTHQNRLAYTDALDTYENFVADMLTYESFAKPVREFQYAFRHQGIRNVIKNNFGGWKGSYSSLIDSIDRYVDRYTKQFQADHIKALDMFSNGLYMGILGLKLSTGTKQLISGVDYMVDMPVAKWAAGTAEMTGVTDRAVATMKLLSNQSFFADRFSASMNMDIDTATKYFKTYYKSGRLGKGVDKMYKVISALPDKEAKELLGVFLKTGDAAPALFCGGGYLWHKYEQASGNKCTAKIINDYMEGKPNKYMDIALNEWNSLSEFTLQSTKTGQVSNFRSAGTWQRLITMFTSGQAQQMRNINMCVRNVLRGVDVGKNLKALAVMQTVQGFLYGFAGTGYYMYTKEEKSDVWWEMMLNNLKGIALFGKVFDTVSTELKGKPWWQKTLSTNPLTDTILKIGTEVETIRKNQYGASLTEKENQDRMMKRQNAYWGMAENYCRMLGLPAKEIHDRYESIKKGFEGNPDVLEILGLRSPAQRKQHIKELTKEAQK